MLKNCSLSVMNYTIYGLVGVNSETYLGKVYSLREVLEFCRSRVLDYDTFSLYGKLTGVSSSELFLGCIGYTDLIDIKL